MLTSRLFGRPLACWILLGTVCFATPGLYTTRGLGDEGIEFFEAKIRPVLVGACYECHAAEAKQVHGGLLVDHKGGLLRGGDSGPSVVPGDVDESLLIGALRHETFEMPPKGKLPDEVINDFIQWIEMGAPDPRTEEKSIASAAMTLEEAKDYWAFQPLVEPQRPSVSQADWPLGEIDYFVLSRMESAGVKPVGPSDKRQWIRRANFDLIGLPPTPDEIEAFLADESPTAYATVIDRLLNSPHYGERWGRHWLDVARYAEDQAHTFAVKPNNSGYRYRDWVIEAFNSDMPYDRFVKLQIAADLVELDQEQRFQHLPALGFFGLGAQYYKNSDAERARADELDDRVDTLTRGFLGLTVSCARCHDHKYDPIPTQDYYSLAGVFQSCRLTNEPLVPEDEVKRYETAEKRLKDAEETVKETIAAEKQTASETQAGRLAEYLMAAWRQRQSRETEAPLTTEQLAEEQDLSELILKRWVQWMDNRDQQVHASFKPWLKAIAETDENNDTDETLEGKLREIAQSIQAELTLALDIRAGRRPSTASEESPTFESGKPRYASPVVTKKNPLIEVDVDVSDAKELYLVITDAGDGKSCDHADWIQPRLIGPGGEIKLTEQKWRQVHAGTGNVRVNKNYTGKPLRVGGVTFSEGIGAHAPCVIVYDLPEGTTRLQSRVGLDNSGTDQGGCGDGASVQFMVYTERPNDFDQIMSGKVKPGQAVLSLDQSALIDMALSDKGLFTADDKNLEKILPAESQKRLADRREELQQAKEAMPAEYPVAHVIAEAKPTDMPIFIRGNPASKGDVAPRRFLKVLAGEQPEAFSQGSGRLELAEAIASRDNPLTARVMVNRIWQQHFGRGLVGTPSNFGSLGESPTHPQLLDYLAWRFVQSGWSMKSLHREIMLSATYQLSSDHDPANAEIDAANRLLWRMNRRRLDVEAWRDSLLAVSGRLDRELGGPSTNLDSPENVRRTVYGKISRHELNALLRLFDFPDANITSEQRAATTVPQQQLFVLNSPFMIQQAKALADRLFTDGDRPREDQIQRAFLLLYGRPASEVEVHLGKAFLEGESPEDGKQLSRAAQYAQVLLGANEFAFID